MAKILKRIFLGMLLISPVIHGVSDYNYESDREKKRREEQYALEVAQAKRSTAIWSGIAGFVGAVAGAAVGSWLASSDEKQDTTVIVVENGNTGQVTHDHAQHYVSPKEVEISLQLDSLSKYGQNFDLHNDLLPGFNHLFNEKLIVLNLHKLGFQLHDIDANFYHKLAQDYKILYDAGYSVWWHSLKSLESRKNCYLLNSKNLIAYFNRHKEFISCCQIVNEYQSLPRYASDLIDWIYRKNYNTKYPIIAYKKSVEQDRNLLLQFEKNSIMRQTNLMARVQDTRSILDHILYMINASPAYRQELDQKRYEELLEESNRLEKERLAIAKKQLEIQEQANKIAAEKNKIERERNQFYKDDRWL